MKPTSQPKKERILNIRKPEIGEQPIEELQREAMNAIARALDAEFNGLLRGDARKVGFVLLVFPYGPVLSGARCNYISNGALRDDIVNLFKEQIVQFEQEKKTAEQTEGEV